MFGTVGFDYCDFSFLATWCETLLSEHNNYQSGEKIFFSPTLAELATYDISLHLLPKYRIELFGDVVLFVFDLRFAQLDDNVWISLTVDISRMKISSLDVEINTFYCDDF